MKRYSLTPLTLLILLTICSTPLWMGCSDDHNGPDTPLTEARDTLYTVALIQPISRVGGTHVMQITDWIQENIKRAQEGMSRRFRLKLELYDEDRIDLDSLALELRRRKEVMAVIGPRYSAHVDVVANRLKGARKTLIAPSATSADLIRSYAGYDFFWALVESDITQCEVVLDRLLANGHKRVALLAASGLYGQTFIDWFAFQASEMQLDPKGIFEYQDNNLETQLTAALASGSDAIICAPGSTADVKRVLEVTSQLDKAPELIFTDVACNPELLTLGELTERTIGVTSCADPESGFEIAHRVRYGGDTTYNKEAQLYDALLLVVAALTAVDNGVCTTMNEAMKEVVATTQEDGSPRPSLMAWNETGMRTLLEGLCDKEGPRYDIRGASGKLDFDTEQQTNVICSIYGYWMIYNGRIVMLSHLSADGSRRTESTLAAWNWLPTISQDFDAEASFDYPTLGERWALLVAGSDSWENYRHQADVLDLYQLLRERGYTDDHIILIQEDNLAQHPQNPYPGEVRRWDDVNLHVNVHTDYHLSDLTPDDLTAILLGQSSDRLPAVIRSTDADNVLVFWCGHGVEGCYLWGERPQDEGMTTQRMRELMTRLKAEGHYRKMLWLVETCYSASVAQAAEELEVHGVMFLTSASPLEPSKAEIKVDGVYRTNRFTRILTGQIREAKAMTYRDFYYNLFRYTIGSHVQAINSSLFDNLYKAKTDEFFDHP